MKHQKFSIAKRLKSFEFALNGLKILIKEEHNSRIQVFIAFCVLIAGFVFKLSALEWISIVFAVGLVIALEILNSAIENISDFVSPENHEKIKKIKDLSAAGVLVGAITAVIVGLIIFLPKISDLC